MTGLTIVIAIFLTIIAIHLHMMSTYMGDIRDIINEWAWPDEDSEKDPEGR